MYNFTKNSQSKDPYNFSMGSSEPKMSNINQTKPSQQQKEQPKSKKGPTKDGKIKSKMISSEFLPKRFGVKYDPPTIILEYLAPGDGKLYHHKMKLLKLKPDTPTGHVLEYIKKKHYQYFQGNKIPDSQITILVDKMKSRMKQLGSSQGAQIKRPNTASTMASNQSKILPNNKNSSISAQQQLRIDQEFDDYGREDSDPVPKKGAQKQPVNQKMVQYAQPSAMIRPGIKGPTPQQDEDDEDDENEEEYEDEYEEGDEYYQGEDGEDEEIDEEEYMRIYKQMNYNNLDMNKLSNEELNKHKAVMEQQYKKNIKKPGDKDYKYDVQKQFTPTQNAEWDMEEDDDEDD